MDNFDESRFDLLLFEGLDLGKEFSPKDKVFLERFQSAVILNLCDCKLYSLVNFPCIPKLERLELSENYLTGEDIDVIPRNFPKLKSLNLSSNAIRSMDSLHALD